MTRGGPEARGGFWEGRPYLHSGPWAFWEHGFVIYSTLSKYAHLVLPCTGLGQERKPPQSPGSAHGLMVEEDRLLCPMGKDTEAPKGKELPRTYRTAASVGPGLLPPGSARSSTPCSPPSAWPCLPRPPPVLRSEGVGRAGRDQAKLVGALPALRPTPTWNPGKAFPIAAIPLL